MSSRVTRSVSRSARDGSFRRSGNLALAGRARVSDVVAEWQRPVAAFVAVTAVLSDAGVWAVGSTDYR
jgi:aminoglycoside/choline kinase family phosphotransferase